MTSLERRLHDALAESTQLPASPDLFERVQLSISADRRRKAELRHTLIRLVVALLAVAAIVAPLCSIDNGRFSMPWWVLEVLAAALLIAIALWLGPFIKRFGRAYAADVFHDNPMTGKSYIVLTDIVYYLIFTAYILFTVRFEPAESWGITVGADQLKESAAKIGGILLVIGILHGLNIVLMPVLGRLFSANRRLSGRQTGTLRSVHDESDDEMY